MSGTAYGQQKDPFHYQVLKDTSVVRGAVVSAHPLATGVGLQILRRGGNAVDAAIAVQLALAVVFPGAGNIGGGGFMVIHLSSGRDVALDYREEAPARASRNMYLDSSGSPVASLSQDGPLSCGVPGTVAGLFEAHRYARLPFSELIQPAIDLASHGFAISEREARTLNAFQSDFIRFNTVAPVFIRSRPWQGGDTLVQKDLAHTLELIRDKGAAGFYDGETAQKIVDEMKRAGGIISAGDLKGYRAKKRLPTIFPYKDFTIVTMPLPSSGGLMIRQMLGMISGFGLDTLPFESPHAVQLMAEVERRSFADRAKFLGDPDFIKVPVDALVDPSYLKGRMSDYSPLRATPSLQVQAGNPAGEKEETTQISVMDSSGNAVSVTYTLNGWYGSRIVVGHAGFFLNDEMDDFSAKPGSPNMFGLLGAEANSISPHKRMLSSMTPTIVLKAGNPFLVLGTPGGSTIITSVFQTIVDVLDFHLPLTQAVDKPKFHEQWMPDILYVETGFPQQTITELEKMGYHITFRTSIGAVEAIERMGNGIMEAVADRRGDDTAMGF
jgi:gamma-glutamyltranspeptidase/glutathione hydrolase